MNKRLGILLAVLIVPAVLQASGTPAPPISPCTVGKPRCLPPGPAPCFRYSKRPCVANPNGGHR
jgi:hypothetical protein